MSNRLAFMIAVLILLVGFFLRVFSLPVIPAGLNDAEIIDARIAETIRQGRTAVYYNVDGQGREGGYPALLTAFTSFTGGGAFTLRVFSVFAGMLTLAVVYALGKRLYGAPTGLLAAALLAVSMLPIVLSRAVMSEALTPLLTAMIVLLLARAYPIYGRPARAEPALTTFAVLGGLLGLGFYVAPANYALVLIAMLFLAALILRRQPLTRRMLSFSWFALVLMITISAPYVIASLQEPGLSGAQRVFDVRVTQPISALLQSLAGLALVGDANPLWNLPERPLLDLVSVFLCITGLIVTVRGWRQPRFLLVLIALVLLAPPALLGSRSPDFLRFAPLLPLLVILCGLGITGLYRSLHSREGRVVTALALAGLMAFNIQWTARDLFVNWPRLPETQVAYHARIGALARMLDQTAAQLPTVICTEVLRPPQSPVHLTDPQLLALTMHRQDILLRYADCRSGLVFPEGGAPAQVVFLEADGLDATAPQVRAWLDQGEPLPIDGLQESRIRLDLAQALAETLGAFITTAPAAYAPESPGGMAVTGPPVRFGGNITFMGYARIWDAPVPPAGVVTVPTYWRVDGQVPTDLTVFIHVQSDPAARPAAQTDTLSVLAETLQPRDVFLQVTTIPLPLTIPPGTYSLSTGAYERNTGMRLPVYDGDAERGDRLFIGEISVAEG